LGGADFTSPAEWTVRGRVDFAHDFHESQPRDVPDQCFCDASAQRINFVWTEYQALIDKATAATDDQTLKTTLHQLTQITLDEAFTVPLPNKKEPPSSPDLRSCTVRSAT